MTERVETQPTSERLFCPNCPADYPTPFSRRYIDCRRCGAAFLAPDEARISVIRSDSLRDRSIDTSTVDDSAVGRDEALDEELDEEQPHQYLRTIRTSAPTIALGFNGAAFCLWLAGIVSFEIAVMTTLLVMNGFVVQDRL